MLSITDLKSGTKLTYMGDPYEVLSYSQSKMGRGGSVVKIKIKKLKSGAVLDKTFQGAEKLDEANLEKKKATFLYADDSNANFMDNSTYDQFTIALPQIGNQIHFMSENSEVDILYFNGSPINIDLPIKLKFAVTEAPPSVRGNTAGAATKKVTIETGNSVDTPLFINVGDIIVVDTRDGSYVERG
jgi:elongation factor P